MRFKRVLLVCPQFLQGRNRLSHAPLIGIGYVAEVLLNSGISVETIDMNLGYRFRDLVKKINSFNPDLIGFTGMTLGYKHLYSIIEKTKEVFPNKKIAIGGAHLSAVREQLLKECEAVDYGIILEGDISMPQLCLGEDLKNIKGIIYRNNSEIVTNQFEGFIEDLDQIPFPKYESFELNKYPVKNMNIITSRGCPYNCIYCSVATSIGKNFRAKSAKRIVEEIQFWYNKGYRDIFILDDNFTLIKERVMEFCELMLKNNFNGLHLKSPAGIRGDRVDRAMLKALKEVGVNMIAFGVESASNKVLKNLKKGENIEIVEKAIQDACELGFDVDLFFVYGSPGETLEDLNKSITFAKKYPVRRAIFYNLIPFPSTELFSWLKDNNFLTEPLDSILNNASYYKNHPSFYTPEMCIDDRKRAFKMGQRTYIEVRRRFIERKIKCPNLIKRIISFIYARPFAEEVVVNSRIMLRFKESLRKLLAK